MDTSSFLDLDIVVVCGLPGAGKSHFSRAYFKDTDFKRVNRKIIRKALYEMTNFDEQWKNEYFNEKDEYLVKHVERKIIEHYLHKSRKVLIDNTSVTKDSRKNYVRIAREMNKSIGVIFINTSVNTCIERNRKSQDKIPEIVISNLYAKIEIPQKDEGFKRVKKIDNY